MTSRSTSLLILPLLASCNLDVTPNRSVGGGQVLSPIDGSPTDLMLVESGPVSVINDNALGGTFTIRRAQANERGIAGSTVGGACIVARVTPIAGLCMRDSDCAGKYNEVTTNPQRKYCVGHYGDVPSGSCYVKPSEASCRKGVGPGYHHPVSTTDVAVITSYAAAQREPQKIDWMVLGCLNGPDVFVRAGEPNAKPCTLRHTPGRPMVVMHSEGPTLRYP